MKRVTLARVNKALKEAGIDARIHSGSGYFYFEGPAMDLAKEQGVYGIYRLNDATIEQWVEFAREKL